MIGQVYHLQVPVIVHIELAVWRQKRRTVHIIVYFVQLVLRIHIKIAILHRFYFFSILRILQIFFLTPIDGAHIQLIIRFRAKSLIKDWLRTQIFTQIKWLWANCLIGQRKTYCVTIYLCILRQSLATG